MGRNELETGRQLRYKIVISAFLLGAASLAAHLFFLQFNPGTREYYARKVEERWHSYECPQGKRGDIYFRDATLLAGSRKVAKVIVEPGLITHLDDVCQTLALQLGKPADEIRAKIEGYKGRGLEIADGVELGTALKIDTAGLQGIFTRYHYERTYPHREYCAAATVGYAGHEPCHRLGLESSFDKLLTGHDGKVVYRKDSARQRLPGSVLLASAKQDGQDLITTLDPSIQTICEEELAGALAGNHADWGCILVMDPRDGEVLAAATAPTFDPNEYVRGNLGAEYNVLIHRPVEPGSTIKPLLAAYAIDRNWLDPQRRFVCNRLLTVGKYTIREAELSHVLGDGAGVPIDKILIKSSNIGMAQVALSLGQDRVEEAYKTLGFFAKTGIELPAESRGIAPCRWAGKDARWPKITIATTGFGQGMSVTPLQLATAYCTLANGGYRVQPTLVLDNGSARVPAGENGGQEWQPSAEPELPEGEILMAGFPTGGTGATTRGKFQRALYADEGVRATGQDGRVQVISPETCELVTTYLERVLTEGTGKAARLQRYTAAGKTGTGQIPSQHGGYASGAYTASFIGYFPSRDARYLVLVMFSRPRGAYYGGAVAAPVFKRVGDRISYVDQLAEPAAGVPHASR